MSDRPRIMIGSVDVTRHVAAMYDALVDSVDWGSGFLDTEDAESVLIIGHLAGFDLPDVEDSGTNCAQVDPVLFPVAERVNRDRAREVIAAWRRQVDAKARAMAEGDSEGAKL